MRNIAKIFLITLLLFVKVGALTLNKDSALMSNVEIYKSSKIVTIKDLNNTLFEPYEKSINIGLSNSEVWVKLNFYNKLDKEFNSLVVFTTTHIDKIKVYEKRDGKFELNSNLNQERSIQGTVFPYFNLKLGSNESKEYYVNIKSSQIPSSFFIKLEDKAPFLAKDKAIQFIDILIVGFLFTVAIYFIILYFNSKEKSYIYFSMFILMALYYLLSYTGLTQIYASKSFAELDKTLFIIKLNMVVVLSSLYSLLFLKFNSKGYLYGLYIFIIIASILEILVASFYDFSYYFVLLASALYGVINVVAGIRAYMNGLKEARFYIVGALILAFGIYANIFSALNVDTIHIDGSKFMIIFAFAILFFIVAYIDRYWSSKRAEFTVFADSLDKKLILNKKIKDSEKELKQLENSQEVLKESINTIIKNNLQATISMLKLQESKVNSSEVLEQLSALESRLVSIVKSYSLFLSANNKKFIVMRDSLQRLVDDTLNVYGGDKKLDIELDVDAVLELEDAIYVGLSIVDFIINRLKDKEHNEKVIIYLKNEGGDYQFSIKDEDLAEISKQNKGKSWFKRVLKGKA